MTKSLLRYLPMMFLLSLGVLLGVSGGSVAASPNANPTVNGQSSGTVIAVVGGASVAVSGNYLDDTGTSPNAGAALAATSGVGYFTSGNVSPLNSELVTGVGGSTIYATEDANLTPENKTIYGNFVCSSIGSTQFTLSDDGSSMGSTVTLSCVSSSSSYNPYTPYNNNNCNQYYYDPSTGTYIYSPNSCNNNQFCNQYYYDSTSGTYIYSPNSCSYNPFCNPYYYDSVSGSYIYSQSCSTTTGSQVQFSFQGSPGESIIVQANPSAVTFTDAATTSGDIVSGVGSSQLQYTVVSAGWATISGAYYCSGGGNVTFRLLEQGVATQTASASCGGTSYGNTYGTTNNTAAASVASSSVGISSTTSASFSFPSYVGEQVSLTASGGAIISAASSSYGEAIYGIGTAAINYISSYNGSETLSATITCVQPGTVNFLLMAGSSVVGTAQLTCTMGTYQSPTFAAPTFAPGYRSVPVAHY